ncbi:hypothetical protein FHU38_002546 [Saccharomonospora amisosensis]|uniref:Uncharacterized protein n=1 Tax=Saccharomonospora amisosensis TaxID=1128677 RepID=A0A7X5UQU4_9PSEU|nr:hypothetical protein [Saccharomonospora amisosensis]NIJ12202.1 hypothetical protein [Saccharomonospora amisosensis]
MIAGIALVGGAITLVLLLGDDEQRTDGPGPVATGSPASATPTEQPDTSASEPTSEPPNTSGPTDDGKEPAPGGQPSNQLLAESLISAINDHDGTSMVDMVCRTISGVDEPDFRDDTSAELLDARDDGENGSIDFTVTEGGRSEDVTFKTRTEGGMWCLAGPG